MEVNELEMHYKALLEELLKDVDEFDIEPCDEIKIVREHPLDVNGVEIFPISKYYLPGDKVNKGDTLSIHIIKLKNLIDELNCETLK